MLRPVPVFIAAVILAIAVTFPVCAAPKRPLPPTSSVSLTPTISGMIFSSTDHLDPTQVYGLKIGYDRTGNSIVDSIGVEGTVNYFSTKSTSGPKDAQGYIFRVDALYSLFPRNKWVPYVAVGLGEISTRGNGLRNDSPLVNYGLGLKYYLEDYLAVRVDLRQLLVYKKVNTNSDFELGTGLTYYFGKERKKKPTPVAPAPKAAAKFREGRVPKPPVESPEEKKASLMEKLGAVGIGVLGVPTTPVPYESLLPPQPKLPDALIFKAPEAVSPAPSALPSGPGTGAQTTAPAAAGNGATLPSAAPPTAPQAAVGAGNEPKASAGQTPAGQTPAAKVPAAPVPAAPVPAAPVPAAPTPGAKAPGAKAPGAQAPAALAPAALAPAAKVPATTGSAVPAKVPAAKAPAVQPPITQTPAVLAPAAKPSATTVSAVPAKVPAAKAPAKAPAVQAPITQTPAALAPAAKASATTVSAVPAKVPAAKAPATRVSAVPVGGSAAKEPDIQAPAEASAAQVIGKVPAAQAPTGKVPAAKVPAGKAPAGKIPAAQAPATPGTEAGAAPSKTGSTPTETTQTTGAEDMADQYTAVQDSAGLEDLEKRIAAQAPPAAGLGKTGLEKSPAQPVFEPTVKAVRYLTIEFEFASTGVRPVYTNKLRAAAALIKASPEASVLIEGHTDNIGRKAVNDVLALERANSVKKQLVKLGVPARIISTKGYGFSKPKVSNLTAKGRQRNRRAFTTVVIVIHR